MAASACLAFRLLTVAFLAGILRPVSQDLLRHPEERNPRLRSTMLGKASRQMMQLRGVGRRLHLGLIGSHPGRLQEQTLLMQLDPGDQRFPWLRLPHLTKAFLPELLQKSE